MSDRSGHDWPERRPHTRASIACLNCGCETGTHAARCACPKQPPDRSLGPDGRRARAGVIARPCEACERPESTKEARVLIRPRPRAPGTVMCADCLDRHIARLQHIRAQMRTPAPVEATP